jgi:hypothetical protein
MCFTSILYLMLFINIFVLKIKNKMEEEKVLANKV